jgi:hypothetical protein
MTRLLSGFVASFLYLLWVAVWVVERANPARAIRLLGVCARIAGWMAARTSNSDWSATRDHLLVVRHVKLGSPWTSVRPLAERLLTPSPTARSRISVLSFIWRFARSAWAEGRHDETVEALTFVSAQAETLLPEALEWEARANAAAGLFASLDRRVVSAFMPDLRRCFLASRIALEAMRRYRATAAPHRGHLDLLSALQQIVFFERPREAFVPFGIPGPAFRRLCDAAEWEYERLARAASKRRRDKAPQ